jgi:ribulose-5-phosphate 4-epimerase/fuculose-1-phosphate aldolase
MHTHEPSTAAVASMKCGFLPGMSQHAMLIGSVPIHKYELTTGPSGPEGCQKMADDFGQTARSILLENHGVIVTGETIPEAMMRLFYITKACDIQVKALAGQQGLSAVNMVTEMSKLGAMEHGGQLFMAGIGGHEFAHWSRIIDRVNPGYNDL